MYGLVKSDKFSPSKTPYALSPRSFRINQHGFAEVSAIWAGRKGGRTTASTGTLWSYDVSTYEELIERIDMRYGGRSEGKWDGQRLITPSAVTPSHYESLLSSLVTALAQFPEMPFPGYEGWFYRR